MVPTISNLTKVPRMPDSLNQSNTECHFLPPTARCAGDACSTLAEYDDLMCDCACSSASAAAKGSLPYSPGTCVPVTLARMERRA
jgi:hypothetical protein